MKTQSFRSAIAAMLTACAVMLAGCGEDLRPKVAELEGQLAKEKATNQNLQATNQNLQATQKELLLKLSQIESAERERRSRLSPIQMQQLAKILDSGSRVNAAIKAGVSLTRFNPLLDDYNGAVELSGSNWPKSLSAETKKQLEDAANCWNFVKGVWAAKIQYEDKLGPYFPVSDHPIPPALSGKLDTSKRSDTFKGHTVALYQEALQVGLAVGSAQFEASLPELNKCLNER